MLRNLRANLRSAAETTGESLGTTNLPLTDFDRGLLDRRGRKKSGAGWQRTKGNQVDRDAHSRPTTSQDPEKSSKKIQPALHALEDWKIEKKE